MAFSRVFLSACFFLLLVNSNAAQERPRSHTITCHSAKKLEDRRICRTLVPRDYYDDYPSWQAFQLIVVKLDLNGDGRSEIIAWESSWAGTSGSGLWILSAKRTIYKKLFVGDSVWSPILSIKRAKSTWLDIAYFQAGGGLDEVFYLLRHRQGRYRVFRTQATPPKGRVLVGKDWSKSVFGPTK